MDFFVEHRASFLRRVLLRCLLSVRLLSRTFIPLFTSSFAFVLTLMILHPRENETFLYNNPASLLSTRRRLLRF